MLDAVVIGSGAGGMAAAVALARAGQKVLVLEQHYLPGGWCHSFNLEGYRFSPGVHYVGELGPGGRLRAIYEGLGVARDLVFCELDPDGYEHVRIGQSTRFDYPKGRAAFGDRLKARFPSDRVGIDAYLDTVVAIQNELHWMMTVETLGAALSIPFRAPNLTRWGLRSVRSLIHHHVKDPDLRAILSAQTGDHGLPPSKVPSAIHGYITAHFLEGAWYPRGGGGAIPRAFIRALRRHGGDIRVSTSVERILLEGKRAIGVRLADGTEIRAREVISNADPAVTMGRLVGLENLGPLSRFRLWRTKWSGTAISLFLAVDMDVRAAGMTSGNLWITPSNDVEAASRRGREDWSPTDSGELDSFFLTATTLKDPSRLPGGHHVLEAFTGVPYEAFRGWAGTRFGERPSDYEALKGVLKARMLASLARALPGVERHIVFAELGTPLTNVHYCAATEGGFYGTEKSAFQIGLFGHPIRTEIAALRLVGASTLMHGVMGAHLSGLHAARDILGCRYDELLCPDGHQLTLVPSEDYAAWPEGIPDEPAQDL